MTKRHPKQILVGRCCWVCGKPGGVGSTQALRLAGYDLPKGTISHAHPNCLRRALKKSITKKS